MKLSENSKNRLYTSFAEYEVDKEWAEIMFNYLVHGFPPGSFFTSLLANDMFSAMAHSHPANTIAALKRLVTWMMSCMPGHSYGSYDAVTAWLKLTAETRREVLERLRLIYSEQDEVVMILKDEKIPQPFFW